MKPKTIFITGATGFVGSNLACEFLKHGYQLKLLVRGENAKERIDKLFCQLFEEQKDYHKIKRNLEIIKGDITKENLGICAPDIHRLTQQGIDVIFHCAASTSFDETRKKEIEKQNVGGTQNILELMCRLKIYNLHYISTAYVAGQTKGIVYEDELDKGQTFNNPYEESKFKAEQLVRNYRDKYLLNTTIYRPAIIVGDSKTGRTSSLFGFYALVRSLWTLMELFKEDLKKEGRRARAAGVSLKNDVLYLPLRVPGLISKTLNLVPIDYVVDVIHKILKNEDAHNKTYHIINPTPPTIGYIQRSMNSILKVEGVRIIEPEEFKIHPMTSWENFFSKSIKNYAPYLERQEPMFSAENTQYILNGTAIRCHFISTGLISKLISYCLHTNWGRK